MTNVTFEDVQQFISKYTLLPVAPESRLVKDLYFKHDDGPKLLNSFGLNFDVNMLACQPQRHFGSSIKMLSPIWLVVIPAILLLLLSSPTAKNVNLFAIILSVAVSVWIMAFLAFKNRDGHWRLPEIDLAISELVNIANTRTWPREMYVRKNV